MKKMIRVAFALLLALALLAPAAMAEEAASESFNLLDTVTVLERPEETTETTQTTETTENTETTETTQTTETTENTETTETTQTTETVQPEETPAPQRSVAIASNIPASEIALGDTVTLTAVLTGFEGVQVEIAWECQVGGVWQPTGRTGETVTFTVDENNAQGAWRITVTVLAGEQAAAQ